MGDNAVYRSGSGRVHSVAVALVCIAGITAACATSGLSAGRSTTTQAKSTPISQVGASSSILKVLRGPAKPPGSHPSLPSRYLVPEVLLNGEAKRAQLNSAAAASSARAAVLAGVTAPAQSYSWGSGTKSTLVLYDTTNTWGYLGEFYAIAAGNLASHFGSVTTEPVVDYVSGQVAEFSATIYIGSTYNEPVPTSFLNDVLTSTNPVIWLGDNIWQLAGSGTAASNFASIYGWDPSTSYFDSFDSILSVSYNGQDLTRSALNGPVLAPHVTSNTVAVVASANCTDSTGTPAACNGIAQAPGGASATSFPWAIRSNTLTYVGEVPFSYIGATDRYLAFSDLLFAALEPTAPPEHQALVRFEDVSPGIDTAAQLETDANYLSIQHIPFSVSVIPDYEDPLGAYNNNTPVSMNISQTSKPVIAAFDAALKYVVSKGGTVLEHGDTHQYAKIDNPFSGVSGDDFEFYRSQCATTQNPPYTYVAPCANDNWIIEEGLLPNDSQSNAATRASTGRALFAGAGLATPTIWETPHYAASAADYRGIDQVFSIRYEQELFFGGQITPGATIDPSHVFGQFFPYTVTDAYGATVIPEDLGNYQPEAIYNNPARPPSVVIASAKAELAVRQGVASFYFHPYYDVSDLAQIVQGVRALGYTFVAAPSLLANTPLTIATAALETAAVNTHYATQLSATGGNGHDTWSITSGSLPSGVTLDATTGLISGTPTVAGTSSITVQVVDTSQPSAESASQPLSLRVNALPLAVAPATLPAASDGVPYRYTLSASGGSGAYTWSIAAGSLPQGLTLNSATGVISGTPTDTSGNAAVIAVTDAATPIADVATEAFGITENPAALTITTSSLPGGTVGTPYTAQLSASGGTPPDVWSITSGSLPAGLSLNSSTGAITGTPTATANSTISVTVTDSTPQAANVRTANFSIVIAGGFTITTSSLPNGTVGTRYSATLAASGGIGTYTWSIASGTLPLGLSLKSSTGAITGTPSAVSSSTITFKVTDSASPPDVATKALALVVTGVPLVITTKSLPNGRVGRTYRTTLAASGGIGLYTWSIASGALPIGLSLESSTGTISGTPTTISSSTITVQVSDSATLTDTATKPLSISISK